VFLGCTQDFEIPKGLALTGKAFFHAGKEGLRVLIRP
jgi:hypothetical protein